MNAIMVSDNRNDSGNLDLIEHVNERSGTTPGSGLTSGSVKKHHSASVSRRSKRASQMMARADMERKRKRVAVAIGVVAAAIFVVAFLMVAIGLRMNNYIDDMWGLVNRDEATSTVSGERKFPSESEQYLRKVISNFPK